MVATEVHVVKDDSSCAARLFEQGGHLIAHVGIEGIVGAEEYDVITLYCGAFPITFAERLLVEGVGGIIVLIDPNTKPSGNTDLDDYDYGMEDDEDEYAEFDSYDEEDEK